MQGTPGDGNFRRHAKALGHSRLSRSCYRFVPNVLETTG